MVFLDELQQGINRKFQRCTEGACLQTVLVRVHDSTILSDIRLYSLCVFRFVDSLGLCYVLAAVNEQAFYISV